MIAGLVLGAAGWGLALAGQLWVWDVIGAVASGLAAGSAVWLVIALYIAPHADQTRGAAFFSWLGVRQRAASDKRDEATGAVLEFSRRLPLLSGVVGGFTLASLILGPYAPEATDAVGFKVGGALVGLLLAIFVVGVLDEAPGTAGDDAGNGDADEVTA